jgi:hypothetical protein
MSPAIIFYAFERAGRTPTGSRAKMLYEVSVFIFSLMFALPSSIALFPQTGMLKTEHLEDTDFLNGEMRTHIKAIYYNKGL